MKNTMFAHPAPTTRRRGGFTLVELLVVIGIVVVLMAILLPALVRAREQGKSVQCLSNLRSLGLAFQMYVQKYERFPRPGVEMVREDWFHWKKRDALMFPQLADEPKHSKLRGGIAEFLDDGGPNTSKVWLCPSDDLDTHVQKTGSGAAYPFSYAVNFTICTYGPMFQQPGVKNWPAATEADGVQRARTLSYTQVKQPERKILIIDESSETIDDGCWAWQWGSNPGRNILSNRHDKRKETAVDYNAGYGNAAFCDGHAERIPRIRTFDPKYYDPFVSDKYDSNVSRLPAPAVAVPPE